MIFSLPKYLKFLLVSLLVFLPLVTLAQSNGSPGVFQSIPYLNDGAVSMEGYVNALYLLSISAASVLAIVMLMKAGVQYMFTDVVPQKQDAKTDIQNALLGLLIILAAITILNTINPNLTKLDFFGNAERVQTPRGGLNSSSNTVDPSNMQAGNSINLRSNGESAAEAKESCEENGGEAYTAWGGAWTVCK